MDFNGRAAKRLESENLLAFQLFDDQDQVILQGVVKTIDISRTGISIESFDPMEVGRKIELTIGLGENVVKAKGTIKNCVNKTEKTYHVGIEFEYLSDDDLNKIAMVYPEILS
ncbi:MAG: PilZ domain-containing protein [Caldisericaceae bacterium]|nr:PilZ domain-containing protein [Caldisericaceae bacterium]